MWARLIDCSATVVEVSPLRELEFLSRGGSVSRFPRRSDGVAEFVSIEACSRLSLIESDLGFTDYLRILGLE